MTTSEVRTLHDKYRRAIETCRDTRLPAETQKRAENDAVALRHAIDDAQLELAESRDADSRRSGGVSVEDASRIVRGGGRNSSTPAELREFAMPKSTVTEYTMPTPNRQFRANEFFKDTGGSAKAGYLYHSAMYDQLVMHLNAASGVIEAGATILSTDHLRDVLVPVLLTDATATQTAELTAATQSYDVHNQLTFTSYRQDGFFLVSHELLLSAEYDLESFLGEYAARAIATKVATSVATDDGSSKPDGLAHAAASGLTTAAVAVVTSDEMIDLYRSVALPYRRIGSFIVSDGLFGQMLKWKNDSGDYLVRTVDRAPATFLGRPLYVEPNFADPATTAKTAVFGDISRYFIRMTPVMFDRSDDLYFKEQIVTYRWAQWIDAHLVDVQAVKALTCKT